MKYFIDTNIIIYLVNGKYPSIQRHFAQIPSSDIYIPAVVLAELEFGASNSRDYEKSIALFHKFTEVFKVAPFERKAAACYGKIRADLKEKGTLIGGNDMLIAASALAENAVLVTHNVSEFNRVEGLRVEDWVE